jgi:SAM-dependent methyltransferase
MLLTKADNPNFDLIARPYRWLEYLTLGRALESCRLHYLSTLLQQKRALILGDGDGRFLAKLLAQNPHLQTDAVDTSATMLELLRHRCEAAGPSIETRLRIHHTSALNFYPPSGEKYDLVVTHFFLDCLTQPNLEALINRIAPTLSPNALWLISDFHIPSGPMRLPAKIIVRSLYLAFRILTGLRTTRLPDHTTPLVESGLTRIAYHHRLAGLLTTELWQLEHQRHVKKGDARELCSYRPTGGPMQIIQPRPDTRHEVAALRVRGPSGRTSPRNKHLV